MSVRTIILAIIIAIIAVPALAAGPRYFDGDAIPFPRLKPAASTGNPLIVIDPGHGGKDPGAVGKNGLLEKTVTTAAAKELKSLLEATGRYDVLLTRSRDSFIDHDDRVRVAREKHADLFISIHADSTGSRSTRGASVYTLAARAKNRSKRIVAGQNWIMDVDLAEQNDSVGDILVDLAQRSTTTQSESFADILLGNLDGKTALVGNSHRRAGYYVLLAPDVPAVLFELGFLSNVQDEKLLKTKSHRKKLMKAVRRSVDEYFAGPGRRG